MTASSTVSLERELVRRMSDVRAWRPGRDPAPVAEALALVVILDAVRDEAGLDPSDRAMLAQQGERALAKWKRGDDALIAGRIVRAGLAVLAAGERPGAGASAPVGLAAHAGALPIARMLRAEPDPLSAALVALHVRRCPRCAQDAALARDAGAGGEVARPERSPLRMLAAAAEPSAMRAPSEGRVVARLDEPAVEAILFEHEGVRRLAIYGDRRLPLRLVAEGVVTEDARGGYWIGRVDASLRHVHATLHAGDAVVEWRIPLT